MAFQYIKGNDENFITLSASTLSSTNADSNFPLTNLAESFVWRMFKFNTAAADMTLTVDLGSAKTCDFCAVNYHTIDSGITSVVLTSDSQSNFATEVTRATWSTPETSIPSFFDSSFSTSAQYWRLTFFGTNGNPTQIGKWVLGLKNTLTTIQLDKWSFSYAIDQEAGLSFRPINKSLYARRKINLSFFYNTEAEKDEILAIFQDSKWGQEAVVIVPVSTEEEVLYGRITSKWDLNRSNAAGTSGIYKFKMVVTEDPFPIVVT